MRQLTRVGVKVHRYVELAANLKALSVTNLKALSVTNLKARPREVNTGKYPILDLSFAQ